MGGDAEGVGGGRGDCFEADVAEGVDFSELHGCEGVIDAREDVAVTRERGGKTQFWIRET